MSSGVYVCVCVVCECVERKNGTGTINFYGAHDRDACPSCLRTPVPDELGCFNCRRHQQHQQSRDKDFKELLFRAKEEGGLKVSLHCAELPE